MNTIKRDGNTREVTVLTDKEAIYRMVKNSLKTAFKIISVVSIAYTIKNVNLVQIYNMLFWCGLLGTAWLFAVLDADDDSYVINNRSAREVNIDVNKDNKI